MHIAPTMPVHLGREFVNVGIAAISGTVMPGLQEPLRAVSVDESEVGATVVVSDKTLKPLRIVARYVGWVCEVLVLFLPEPPE